MKIRYTDYLHNSKEDNWEKLQELQENYPSLKNMSEEAMKEFQYTLYEVEFEMELDSETGKAKIISATET